MTRSEKILVSGAGGFIGGWLAESIHLNGVFAVKAGIRRWHRAVRLSRFQMDVAFFDVLKKDEIAHALDGVSRVVHCASGDSDAIVNGTRNMLEMALERGIQQFIHLSSAEVYSDTEGVVREQSPFRSTGSLYGDSKIEAEKHCLEYSAKGLPITILRPSIVYGPFSRNWTVMIADRLRSGNWGLLERESDGYCNLIYISDLVSGIEHCVTSDEAIGEAFNLNGPQVITWNEYFKRFNEALGFQQLKAFGPYESRFRAGIIRPVRSSVKFMLTHFDGTLKRIYDSSQEARSVMQYAEQKIKAVATSEQLELYSRKVHYSDEKARQRLGFQPAIGVDEGIRQSVLWLRHLRLA